jgi:hypothetical protein
VPVLELDEQIEHGLRDAAGRADVLARPGLERVEAALLVELQRGRAERGRAGGGARWARDGERRAVVRFAQVVRRPMVSRRSAWTMYASIGVVVRCR